MVLSNQADNVSNLWIWLQKWGMSSDFDARPLGNCHWWWSSKFAHPTNYPQLRRLWPNAKLQVEESTGKTFVWIVAGFQWRVTGRDLIVEIGRLIFNKQDSVKSGQKETVLNQFSSKWDYFFSKFFVESLKFEKHSFQVAWEEMFGGLKALFQK